LGIAAPFFYYHRFLFCTHSGVIGCLGFHHTFPPTPSSRGWLWSLLFPDQSTISFAGLSFSLDDSTTSTYPFVSLPLLRRPQIIRDLVGQRLLDFHLFLLPRFFYLSVTPRLLFSAERRGVINFLRSTTPSEMSPI